MADNSNALRELWGVPTTEESEAPLPASSSPPEPLTEEEEGDNAATDVSGDEITDEVSSDEQQDEQEPIADADADGSGEPAQRPDAEGTYRIGKETLTKDEIVQRASVYYGFDVATVQAETAEKLISTFIDSQNLAQGRKSLNKGHREIAEKKRGLSEQEQSLAKEKRQLSQFETQLKQHNEQLEQQRLKLENDKKYLLEQKERIQNLLSQNPDEVFDEKEAIKLEVKQEFAKDGLPNVEKVIQNNAEELKAIEQQLKVNKERLHDMYMESLYQDLTASNPELNTSKHFLEVINEIESTGKIKNVQEAVTSEFIADVLTSYVQSQSKLPISEFYKVRFAYKFPFANSESNGRAKSEIGDIVRERSASNARAKAENPPNPVGVSPTAPKLSNQDSVPEAAEVAAIRKAWGINR